MIGGIGALAILPECFWWGPADNRESALRSTWAIWLSSSESARPHIAAATKAFLRCGFAPEAVSQISCATSAVAEVSGFLSAPPPTNEVPQFMARVDYRQAA